MKENLESEVKCLKEQVQLLQNAVNTLQQESERKELSLAKLLRDKEKLHKDKEKLIKDKEKLANSLRREKLSSTDLKNQLDNERRYYFEVKESYTQEMNEARQLKRKLSKKSCNILTKKLEEDLASCKSEVKQLKDALRETLEANYNLSIRFLRMKTTKSQFKNRFRKIQEDQTKIAVELESRITLLNKELNFVVNNEFKNCISPSNKRYLQIIKQNGNLLHENFCLQMEIEKLNEQLNKMFHVLTKYKLNSKLKYFSTNCANVSDVKNGKSKTIINEKQTKSPITTRSTEQSLKPEVTISTSVYHNETNQLHLQENHNKNKEYISKIRFKEKNERYSSIEQKTKKKFNENCLKDTNKIKTLLTEDKEKIDEKLKLKEPKKLTMRLNNNKVFLKDSTFPDFNAEKKADVNKTCDSDGLDLVQVSEVHSKTSAKTGGLWCGDAPVNRPSIFKTPFTINFVVSNRSFRTQSCPDVLCK